MTEKAEQPSSEISLTEKPETEASEFIPEISIAEILARTDYEDAAIAGEILEEGRLPVTETEFLASSESDSLVLTESLKQLPEGSESLVQTETQETEESEPETEKQQVIEILEEASENTPAGEFSPEAELPET